MSEPTYNYKLIDDIKDQVGSVTIQMRENISKALENSEKLDELECATEETVNHAKKFSSSTTKLRNKLWWRNTKLIVILVIIVLVFIAIIIGAICGGGQCKH